MVMHTKGCVLITGATSGIGLSTAGLLAGRGYYVFAGYRNPAARENLERLLGERGEPLALDVVGPDEVTSALQSVSPRALSCGRFFVINNAGESTPGPVETLDLADVSHQFQVNFFGPLAVIIKFLPLIRETKGGVVNVSSLAGRIALPGMASYAASKFALEAMSDSLRAELRRFRIPVVLIEPGAIHTPIWTKSEEYMEKSLARLPATLRQLYAPNLARLRKKSRSEAARGLDPARVAEVILRALDASRPKARYLVGVDAHLGLLLKAILPTAVWDAIAEYL